MKEYIMGIITGSSLIVCALVFMGQTVVEKENDFAIFAESCLYPPAGRRGVGISRCNKFGDEFDEYFEGFQPNVWVLHHFLTTMT